MRHLLITCTATAATDCFCGFSVLPEDRPFEALRDCPLCEEEAAELRQRAVAQAPQPEKAATRVEQSL
jgi:hypothetical protein